MSLKEEREAAKAAKAAGAEARRAQEAERRARLAQQVQAAHALGNKGDGKQVDAVALDFCSLGEKKRGHVLSLVRDFIPLPSYIELHAAVPPQRLDYEHADIWLRVRTRQEHFRLRACAKEPFTISWIHDRIGAADVLFDIGANVGTYSLVAAMKPGSDVRVFAFEPSYASIASMCDNIVLNGVADRMTPLPIALTDRTGMNVFSLRDLEPGSARHALGDGAVEEGPTLYRQPVMTFRLDDAIDALGLPLPNHMKLDVDGGELEVLNGAARTLRSPELRSMLVEVSVALSTAVTEVLEAHGFRLDARMSVQNKSGEYAVWYGVFARGGA